MWRRHALPALLLALLLPLMVTLSTDYGVTWDELPRQAYGERVWKYYEGRLPVTAFRTDPAGSHLYGGLFDVTAVALQKTMPRLDPYVIRHALNAAWGWLGVVCVYVLATRLGGSTTGMVAMAIVATTPRYWADAMNNPKDLPFAVCATAALAVMAAVPTQYPFLTWGRTLALGLAIGVSLAVRPGGLLFLGYAGIALAVQMARSGERRPRRWLATAGMFAVAVGIATTVPLPFWPWLQQRPYVGLVEAVAGVSNFEWRGTMIFDGGDVHSQRLPWTYVPTWLLYTTPLVTLAGVALAIALLVRRSPQRAGAWGMLAAALFPIAYVIERHSTLYDGIRHLLFIVPPLVVLAALGWTAALTTRHRLRHGATVIALVGLLAEPVAFSVRNHPHQTVYFNPLLGGPRQAVGRFELDYWGNCLYQAQQRVAAIARRAQMPVTISGHRWRMMLLNAGRLPQMTIARPEMGRHHLEIALHRGTRAQVRALVQRGDVIDRVETADGAVLCSILPGPALHELTDRLGQKGGGPLGAALRR